ncbi:zinc ribbon domain-containing protein [Hoeflea olei]|uniref:zinc ribbon domain-containing protein n=1 Tax=Hoeflea olei TaxID=1480615 RepID=UPI001112142F
MAAIACPDCGNTVSDSAETCPHCGRPQPGKSLEQIESDNNSAAWGLLWLAHAIILGFYKKSIIKGLLALLFGPLMWFF